MEKKLDKGILICVEGMDGTGKTTMINKIKEKYGDKLHYFREPGSTSAGEAIRNILLSDEINTEEYTDILLFTASRYELYIKNIKPLLDNNQIVIIDRFLPSTLVYQPMKHLFKGDLDKVKEMHKTIMNLHSFVDFENTFVYLMDEEPKEIQRRITNRPEEMNKRDNIDIHTIEILRNMYIYVCNSFFKDNYVKSEVDIFPFINKLLKLQQERK